MLLFQCFLRGGWRGKARVRTHAPGGYLPPPASWPPHPGTCLRPPTCHQVPRPQQPSRSQEMSLSWLMEGGCSLKRVGPGNRMHVQRHGSGNRRHVQLGTYCKCGDSWDAWDDSGRQPEGARTARAGPGIGAHAVFSFTSGPIPVPRRHFVDPRAVSQNHPKHPTTKGPLSTRPPR